MTSVSPGCGPNSEARKRASESRFARPLCSECGPGYRVGDEGCRHDESMPPELFTAIWNVYTASGGTFNAAKEVLWAEVQSLLAARDATVGAAALRSAADEWQERAAYALTEDWLRARADRLADGGAK